MILLNVQSEKYQAHKLELNQANIKLSFGLLSMTKLSAIKLFFNIILFYTPRLIDRVDVKLL